MRSKPLKATQQQAFTEAVDRALKNGHAKQGTKNGTTEGRLSKAKSGNILTVLDEPHDA